MQVIYTAFALCTLYTCHTLHVPSLYAFVYVHVYTCVYMYRRRKNTCTICIQLFIILFGCLLVYNKCCTKRCMNVFTGSPLSRPVLHVLIQQDVNTLQRVAWCGLFMKSGLPRELPWIKKTKTIQKALYMYLLYNYICVWNMSHFRGPEFPFAGSEQGALGSRLRTVVHIEF